jgi:hypothetical protein
MMVWPLLSQASTTTILLCLAIMLTPQKEGAWPTDLRSYKGNGWGIAIDYADDAAAQYIDETANTRQQEHGRHGDLDQIGDILHIVKAFYHWPSFPSMMD